MSRAVIAGAILAAFGFFGSAFADSDVPKTKAEKTRAAVKIVEDVLRQESNGKVEDRIAALKTAVELAPTDESVLGLSGFVFDEKKKIWLRYDEATAQSKSDERLELYRTIRAKTPKTEAAQMDLAKWCLKRGLDEQATAHVCMALELNSKNAEAHQLLGQKLINGVWVSMDDLADMEENESRIQASVKKWSPKLEKIRDKMDGSKRQAEYGRKELAALADPEAAWAVEAVFCEEGGETAKVGIETLRKLKGRESAACLTKIALLAQQTEMGKDAAKALASQNKYDYVPQLLSLFQTPVQATTQIYAGIDGSFLYRQIYFADGIDAKDVAVFDMPYRHIFVEKRARDSNEYQRARLKSGNVSSLMAERQEMMARMVADAERKAAVRNAAVAARNITVQNVNSIVCSVLAQAIPDPSLDDEKLLTASSTAPLKKENSDADEVKADSTGGNELVDEETDSPAANKKNAKTASRRGTSGSGAATPSEWTHWWYDYNEMYVPEPETRVTYSNAPVKNYVSVVTRPKTSCLTADTPVWTEYGVKPIVKVVEGDRVFACDPETGALALKTVLKKTVRKAENTGPLVTICAAGKTISASGGHVFWVAGQGWIKARNLKVGMRLHTITGVVEIESVGARPAEATYNFIVADYHSYFAGEVGCLTHDNTIRRPTNMASPGLSKVKLAEK